MMADKIFTKIKKEIGFSNLFPIFVKEIITKPNLMKNFIAPAYDSTYDHELLSSPILTPLCLPPPKNTAPSETKAMKQTSQKLLHRKEK